MVEAGVGGTDNFLDNILKGFNGKDFQDLRKVSKFMDLWGTFDENTAETISVFQTEMKKMHAKKVNINLYCENQMKQEEI